MQHPGFFDREGPFSLAHIAEVTGAAIPVGADAERRLDEVRTLADAGPNALSFLDNRKYFAQLERTRAGACLIAPAVAARAPAGTVCLLTAEPYRAFARALKLFYPAAWWPQVTGPGAAPVDETAVLEDGVTVEPGAFVGPDARIGRGTRLAAGAVVGRRVYIGRDCFVGPNAAVTHAIVGDRVIIHAGVAIGQDGFGFALGRAGHLKVPQVGRVIVQNDVEIGANSCIDRGALSDTVIGEGTKIDNLVQIAHNVVVGRHCVIAAGTGISGSTELGDFVVMGGHSGSVGHIKIGAGAQIGGAANATHDIPPGARVGGTPARPIQQWGRELAFLARVTQRRKKSGSSGKT